MNQDRRRGARWQPGRATALAAGLLASTMITLAIGACSPGELSRSIPADAGHKVGWVWVDGSPSGSGTEAGSPPLPGTEAGSPHLPDREAGAPPPPPPGKDSGAPPPPPPGTGFSFFAVGDTRSNMSVAQQNYKSMATLDPKAIAVFNSGDITSDGEDSQWQDQMNALLLGAGGKIKPELSAWDPNAMRYFGIVGNHDIHDGSWFSSWNKYLPGQQGLGVNASSGIYFSLTYGNALFVVLDSEHTSSAQTSWLQQTLAAAAATSAIQWKFVFFHAPTYPCNYKSPFSGGVPWAREFEKYGVDMAFHGHAHVYQRSCPMVQGQCQTGGVIYVVAGGGGAGTHDITSSELTAQRTVGGDSYDCAQIMKAAKGNWHHYCHLQVAGKSLSYACYSHTATSGPEDTLVIAK